MSFWVSAYFQGRSHVSIRKLGSLHNYIGGGFKESRHQHGAFDRTAGFKVFFFHRDFFGK